MCLARRPAPVHFLHIGARLSSLNPRCSGPIEDCSRPASSGTNEAGRGVGARFLHECTADGVGLRFPCDHEEDLLGAAQCVEAQRDPVDEGLEAGILLGLSRETSTQLVVQTMLGTARLLRDEKIHPVELREAVTSPGGTTIQAIRELEQAGVRAAFLNAIQAAMERSRELASGEP